MQRPKLIISDFDGTLTLDDELTKDFFSIVDLLDYHEISLVVCTGRSKSWAHFLLSHFHRLDYVISEGGGVLSKVDKSGGRRLLCDELLIDEAEVVKLEFITERLLKKFPQLSLSTDSFGRQSDRACELSELKADPTLFEAVKDFLRSEGANFSTSNIHLNFWCGDFNKMSSINYFLENMVQLKNEEVIFFGDSLNDQSAFAGMTHSVGVSNIEKVIDQMSDRPKVILEGEQNKGPLGVYNYLKDLLK